MKESDLRDAIQRTPVFFAIFKIASVPYWLEKDWSKGDRIFAKIDHMGYLDGVGVNGKRISIKPTFVTFVEYKPLADVCAEFGVPKQSLLPNFR